MSDLDGSPSFRSWAGMVLHLVALWPQEVDLSRIWAIQSWLMCRVVFGQVLPEPVLVAVG